MHRFFTSGRGAGGSAASACSAAATAEEEEDFHEFSGTVLVIDLADVSVGAGGRAAAQDFEGRAWLEDALRRQLTLGFDLEWRSDRQAGSDNRVALIQLATEDTALLIRTHRTMRWLPQIVVDVITSPLVRKASVNFDAGDGLKLQRSFGLQAAGVTDLSALGARKGVERSGLKSLTQYFGWSVRKDGRIACSDWEADVLSPRQRRYAADDAYFSLLLLGALEALPDVEAPPPKEVPAEEPASQLSFQPGWVESGIIRKHDGFWCSLCNKGPILNGEVVRSHLDSKLHQKKAQPPPPPMPPPPPGPPPTSPEPPSPAPPAGAGGPSAAGAAAEAAAAVTAAEPAPTVAPTATPAVEVPPDLLERGIRCVEEGSTMRACVGDLVCELCDAGPFQSLDAAKAHLRGRSHCKREAARVPLALTPELEAAGIVLLEEDETPHFFCTLCEVGRFQDPETASRHAEGRQHRRRASSSPGGGGGGGPAAQAEEEGDPLGGDAGEAAAAAEAARETAASAAARRAVEEQLLRFPGYVQITEDCQVVCVLCHVRAAAPRGMLQHLDSARHARACRRWGEPEVMYVPERDRLEEVDTGRAVVRRTGSWASERGDAAPAATEQPRAPPRSGLGGRQQRRRHAEESAPSLLPPPPLGAPLGPALGRWAQWAAEVAAEGQAADGGGAAERGRPRVVRFAGEEEEEEDAGGLKLSSSGCSDSDGAGSSSGSVGAGGSPTTAPRQPLSASAWEAELAEASGDDARATAGAGVAVRALRDVPGAASLGSAAEREGGCLLYVAQGDMLIVEAKDPSGAWLFGRTPCGRCGWLQASDVEGLDGGGGGGDDKAGASDAKHQLIASAPPPPGATPPAFVAGGVGGAVVACAAVLAPAPGWAAANFLLLEVGDAVQVQHVEDEEWLWGRKSDGCEGWAPVSAFGGIC